ncbi:unnamed protein product [Pedinophyceae sp. YPF-701]|nr:unnamed protein product [Pedinophyceae sp. YPF-701]
MGIDEEWFKGLRVKDLRDELKKLSLPTTGRKQELQDRLREALEQPDEGGSPKEAPAQEEASPSEPEKDDEPGAKRKAEEPPEDEPKRETKRPAVKRVEASSSPSEPRPASQRSGSPDQQSAPPASDAAAEAPAAKPSPAAEPKKARSPSPPPKPAAKEPTPARKPGRPSRTPPAAKAPEPADDRAERGSPAGKAQAGSPEPARDASPSADADADVPPGATVAVRIDRFVRPLTEPAVRAEVEQCGKLVGFWMPRVKTHCYAVMATARQAAAVVRLMDGRRFPDTRTDKRVLAAAFVDPKVAELAISAQRDPEPKELAELGIEARKGARAAEDEDGKEALHPRGGLLKGAMADAMASAKRAAERKRAEEAQAAAEEARGTERKVTMEGGEGNGGGGDGEAVLSVDDLFKFTKEALPKIYWVPVSAEAEEVNRSHRLKVEARNAEVRARRERAHEEHQKAIQDARARAIRENESRIKVVSRDAPRDVSRAYGRRGGETSRWVQCKSVKLRG